VHTSLDQSTDTLTKQKSNGAAMEQSPILQNYALSPRPKLPTAWPSQIRFPQSSPAQRKRQETRLPNPSSGSHEPRANRAAFHPSTSTREPPGARSRPPHRHSALNADETPPASCPKLGVAPPRARSGREGGAHLRLTAAVGLAGLHSHSPTAALRSVGGAGACREGGGRETCELGLAREREKGAVLRIAPVAVGVI
jgi:hypothetical protein